MDYHTIFRNSIRNSLRVWSQGLGEFDQEQARHIDTNQGNIYNAIQHGLKIDSLVVFAVEVLDKVFAYIEWRGTINQWRPLFLFAQTKISILPSPADIQFLNRLGQFFRHLARFEEALWAHDLALTHAMQHEEEQLYAQTNYNLGEYYLGLDQLSLAEEHSKLAITYFEQQNDVYWLSVSLNTLGEVYRARQLYELAQDFLMRAVDCVAQTPHQLFHSRFKNNLSLVYQGMGLLDQAEKELNEAIQLIEQSPYEIDLMRLYVNRGFIFASMTKWHKAVEMFSSVRLDFLTGCDQYFLYALTLMNLGYAQFKLGRYPLALSQLQESIPTWLKLNKKLYLANTYGCLGEVWLAQKDLQQSRYAFEQAIVVLSDCADIPQAQTMICEYRVYLEDI